MGNQNKSTLPEPVVYISGKYEPRFSACVSAFDRGFLYGDGFFETTRIFGGSAMFLELHIERMGAACAEAGWSWRPETGRIAPIAAALIERNRVDDGYLRITVSSGLHEGALNGFDVTSPSMLVEARCMDIPPPNSALPFVLIRASFPKNERSPVCRFKSISYQENLLALAQGRRLGGDEVYFLNTCGHLAEGAISNIFFVRDGSIFTPDLSCGILPGITRRIVIERCMENNLTISEGKFSEEDLLDAQEIFCTNSLRGVVPVSALIAQEHRREIKRRPVTARIAELYSAA